MDAYLNERGGLPDPETDSQFYSGVPSKRFAAFVIDMVAVMAISIAICIATIGVGFFLFALVYFITDAVYRIWSISSRSATPGMRVLKIELRNRAGDRFDTGQAVFHTILFYLSIYSGIIHLISVIMMVGSSMGRGLHDLPLGSAMINAPE